MQPGEKPLQPVEWGLLIGALALIDLCEIGLDAIFGIGLAINPFIDFFVAGSLLLYCKIRGITLSKERLLSIGAALVGESLAGEGLWVVDGLYICFSVKAEEYIEKFAGMIGPMGNVAKMAIQKYRGGGAGGTGQMGQGRA